MITTRPVYSYVEVTILYFNKLGEIHTNFSEKIPPQKNIPKLLIENISCRVNYSDSDGDVNNHSTPEVPLLSELNGQETADIERSNNTDDTGRLSSSTIYNEGNNIYL